jgi:hypothetical protein
MKTPINQIINSRIATTLAFTALFAASAGAQPSTKTFTPASARALPGLQCKLYPDGKPSAAITIFTDDDGYARFARPKAMPSGGLLWSVRIPPELRPDIPSI